MTGQHWNETVLPQSWRRVLGLSSRAVLVTLQRYLDLRSLWLGRFSWNYTTVLLAGMLLLTTFAMQKTMQKHWSARLNGHPHGTATGWITAILQLSALWEMVDKITTHGRPQMDPQGQAGHLRQPLVGSRPAKGSRGENVMRGVRKMSMVNLPQAMLSLWVHAPQLVRRSEAGSLFWLILSFLASVACVALGVADFVLYIWVYDAFVKENKKLVTIHYCVEILARVPAVVLFHITYSRHHHYVPTLILFLVDVLLTSVLLLKPRLADFPAGRFSRAMGDRETASTARKRPQDCCCCSICCCCSCSRQTCSQFLYAMVVAVMLFVLNIVFFDPGMIFFNLNKVFYMIKYLELIVMSRLIFQTSSQSGDPVLGVQVSWQTFLIAQLLVTVANIGLVFFYVPCRRSQKDTHLISNQSPHREERAEMGLQFRSPRSSNLMEVIHTRPLLDRLESIFELLLLLSNADSTHNRRILLAVVVQELSNQSGLDGTYEDDKRQRWRLKLQGETLTCSSEDGRQTSSGFFLQGTDVLLPGTSGLLRGQFDGWKRIQWSKDSKVWMRLEQREDATHTVQDDVLKLILPQLALALRWERHLEVSERPLLHFLIQKSLAPQRMHFMTDLYWALLCLSAEEEVKDVYCQARIELLRQLPPSHKTFLQGQFELLKQVMLLQKHVGKAEGSGAYQVRTELLQNFLRRLRDGERSSTNDHMDFLAGLILVEEKGLLQPAAANAGQLSASSSPPEVEQHPDLVSPEGVVTLPIDPTSKFQGVIIEECEVLASKQAPIVLSCKMQSLGNGNASRAQASGAKSEAKAPAQVRMETSKYLAKVGDDLRQDQLMLQLMDLMEFVWQARLPKEDLKKLRRPKFRVQAITPDMGCVKFVPDSKPLTDALHQSRGDLVAWLEEHKPAEMSRNDVFDNLCGSVAASSVATYVLGIGDRHLENICITRSGHIFHVDFGFVLGDDPKPCAPQVRLPQQVAHALLVTDRLQECFRLAGLAYVNVRPFAGLFASVLHLTAAAGGAGCQKLTQEPTAAVSGVRERLRDQERQTSRAQEEFLCLMRESSEGLASILMDKVHAAGLFWR